MTPPERLRAMLAPPRRLVRRGELIAMALSGSWRATPPALALQASDLAAIAPLLQLQGGAGLAWRRLRDGPLQTHPAAVALRESYRTHAIREVLFEQTLRVATGALQAAGIDPIVAKGWAVARWYPRSALRPYGDLDLFVPPAQMRRAAQVIAALPDATMPIELQHGFGELDDRSWPSLYARSQVAQCGRTPIRLLSAEDEFRHLCLHFLRHAGGNTRAIWLCDIAVALDRLPPAFDWDYCLRGSRRRAAWMLAVLRLAHQLLDADLRAAPLTAQAAELPRWLVDGVLSQWGFIQATTPQPVGDYLRHPRLALSLLRHAWANPLAATIQAGGRPTPGPRLPYQARYLADHVFLYMRARTPWRMAPRPSLNPEEESSYHPVARVPI